jgi:hypothetical protein
MLATAGVRHGGEADALSADSGGEAAPVLSRQQQQQQQRGRPQRGRVDLVAQQEQEQEQGQSNEDAKARALRLLKRKAPARRRSSSRDGRSAEGAAMALLLPDERPLAGSSPGRVLVSARVRPLLSGEADAHVNLRRAMVADPFQRTVTVWLPPSSRASQTPEKAKRKVFTLDHVFDGSR